MAIVDGYCPHCGGKNRHRESSKGTIQRCDYCGQKYKILTDEEAAAKIAEEAARAEEQRKPPKPSTPKFKLCMV